MINVPFLSLDKKIMIDKLTNVRFKCRENFKLPEALILVEQNFMSKADVQKLCEQSCGYTLVTPPMTNIPKDILDYYRDKDCIPFRFDPLSNIISIMILVENKDSYVQEYDNSRISKHIVPIYYYVEKYKEVYGYEPDFLSELTAKDALSLIMNEGIELGASDVHIVPKKYKAEIFYKVRKKKVYSNCSIDLRLIPEIIKLISVEAKAAYDTTDVSPKYMALTLDYHHRGRVVINNTIYGKKATTRILSNDIFNKKLEELNLDEKSILFLRKFFESNEKGLRLIVGPTSSGKNTTMAAVLHEINADNSKVMVSVEYPVEIYLENVEQIEVQSEEQYILNAESLIRSDPDIVYLSEFTDKSAESIMKVVNTAKPVFSTIHANNIAGVISRIQDLTGLSYARIIEQMHAVIFQELVRDEARDAVFPVTHYMYFTEEFKEKIYPLSYGDLIIALNKEEKRWMNMSIEELKQLK